MEQAMIDNQPRRNVELKARLPSLTDAQAMATNLSGGPPLVEHQVDTYFGCRTGRLKLREIGAARAQLIAYSRPDQFDAKLSRYLLVDVADGPALKQLLAESLGVETIVRKTREIYFFRNVRIHLDQVEGLGAFLEFEAVLSDGMKVDEGAALVDELSRRFNIQSADRIDLSYGDLANATSRSPSPQLPTGDVGADCH